MRWLTPPRDIAAIVTDSGPGRLAATLFHFGPEERPMGAELYLLSPGSYTFTLSPRGGQGGRRIEGEPLTVSGRRTRIAFTLPPRRLCTLSVEAQ